MQLAIAMLYWAFLFADHTAIPAYRSWATGKVVILSSRTPQSAAQCNDCPKYQTTAISTWLYQHYQTCLWSHLLFTLSLCLAGVVRHVQQGQELDVFEGVAIRGSVAISVCSLLLTAVSAHQRIERSILFRLGFCFTLLCALVVEIFPIIAGRPRSTGYILQACIDYADRNNLPWKMGAVRPFDAAGITVLSVTMGLLLLLQVVWLLLRRLERRETVCDCLVNQSKRKCKLWRLGIIDSTQSTRKRLEKLGLVILLGLLSVFVAYIAINSSQDLMTQRGGMDVLWDGNTGKDFWGIGQIGAPFAWAPLLIDMAYSASDGIRQWRGGRAQKSEATIVAN
jgi:hypothetical protein